jgi:predicted branched-subunit amino acid permease
VEFDGYSSPRAALLDGVRVSLGAPSAVLAAGYLGFAALAKAAQFPLWAALLSTATIWALPGQLVMVEMSRAGAALAVTVIAVAFTAMRFLPMTVSFIPLVREPHHRPWQLYASAHVLAMTNWALCIGRVRRLPPGQRLPYFLGFAVSGWLVCIATTLVGYAMVDSFPPLVNRGLVMITVLYYTLILSNEHRDRLVMASLLLGAACGPLLTQVTPQWSILLAGLVGGSIAYLAFRRRRG